MALKSVLFRSFIWRNNSVNLASVAVQVHKYEGYRHRYEKSWSHRKTLSSVLFGALLVGSSNKQDTLDKPINVSLMLKTHETDKEKDVSYEAGLKRPDLPTFKAEEVSKHDNKESFWVTYKSGVYDVTQFLISHPGGEQIMNAAGLSIEPFWNVYGMHKTEEVFRLLETFRIGNLHEDDIVDHTDDELWVKEPVRSKQLIVKTAKPFNAEIPPKSQIEHFDTPNELFYVRQHMPVPELEAKSHRLRVVIKPGKGASPTVREFSLEELEQFQKFRIRAALMCAGNRRSEMNKQVKPVKGISWAGGAISNAVWGGVLLRDVLLHCGVDPYDVVGKHVIFQGSDIDATGVNFSTSIPLHMALDPNTKVLLATEMNSQQLPLDHGYPLRALVPGAPAVRSVKWLDTIIISEDESPSHWHQKDYRAFNPSKTWETANFETAPPVYSLPVTSAICEPLDGDTVDVEDGHVEVKGYAYSGGGAKILRVDVTSSGGASWLEAEALAMDDAPPSQHFSWLLWRARVPVEDGQTELELWAKATDSNFNTQPEKFDDIWNIRGILSNAYHRIKINLKHRN